MATFKHCKITSIGQFAGGSWGRHGNPSDVVTYYRVDCPAMRRAVAADRHNVNAYSPYTFASLKAAEAFAIEEDASEDRRIAERAALAEEREQVWGEMRSAMRRIGISYDAGDRPQWLTQITPDAVLTQQCRERIAQAFRGPWGPIQPTGEAEYYGHRFRYGRRGNEVIVIYLTLEAVNATP
jgi:hypothetical protein